MTDYTLASCKHENQIPAADGGKFCVDCGAVFDIPVEEGVVEAPHKDRTAETYRAWQAAEERRRKGKCS